jgi:hypothetical protein
MSGIIGRAGLRLSASQGIYRLARDLEKGVIRPGERNQQPLKLAHARR